MLYWIAGYLLGMTMTAAFIAWSDSDISGYTAQQFFRVALMILFWPPLLILLLCIFMVSFFNSLFQLERKSHDDPIS